MNIIFKLNVYVDLIGLNRNEIILLTEKDFIVAINCILRSRIVFLLQTTWTPLHSVVHADQSECLEFLLNFHSRLPQQPGHVTLQELVEISDSDGWTVIHVAASKSSTVRRVYCLRCHLIYSIIETNFTSQISFYATFKSF